MLYTLLRWFLYSLVILFIAWLIPGIHVSGIQSALIAIVIIGLINAITLPINLLTLGLFSLVINALLFMLASYLTPGFAVDGFWSALLGSVILSALSIPINKIDKEI